MQGSTLSVFRLTGSFAPTAPGWDHAHRSTVPVHGACSHPLFVAAPCHLPPTWRAAGFEDGRQQLEWSATTLAWAYHAARLAGEAQGGAGGVLAMTRALPPVLTVHAHLLFSLPDWRPGQPQPGAYRVEALPVLGCPLTVYYNYQHGRVHYRRW